MKNGTKAGKKRIEGRKKEKETTYFIIPILYDIDWQIHRNYKAMKNKSFSLMYRK